MGIYHKQTIFTSRYIYFFVPDRGKWMMRYMVKDADPRTRKIKWVKWTARIWGTLIVAYVLLIVIGLAYNLITLGEADPHAEENIPLIEYSGPIFVFISTIGLALALKWEGIGGSIAVVSQLFFLLFLIIQEPVSLEFSFIGPLIISMFIIIPGLFYIGYRRRMVIGTPSVKID